MSIRVRPLAEGDFEAWWALRLRMLGEHPEAFGGSYGEAVADGAERQRERFLQPGSFIVGAFDGETLVGAVGCVQQRLIKMRHKAVIWGMYVAPAARGRVSGRRWSRSS